MQQFKCWGQTLYKHSNNNILRYLVGLAVVQIPELDVSVANSYKVGAVFREGGSCHLTGHLVSSHDHVLLQENHTPDMSRRVHNTILLFHLILLLKHFISFSLLQHIKHITKTAQDVRCRCSWNVTKGGGVVYRNICARFKLEVQI